MHASQGGVTQVTEVAAKPLAPRVRRPRRSAPKKVGRANYVQLFPAGVALGTDVGRPILVLKDKNDSEVLPVWMHPLDAGLALAEIADGGGFGSHAVSKKLLEHLELLVESCTFTDLIGHHQFVEIQFVHLASATKFLSVAETDTPPGLLRLRADDAMSFCLQAGAKFYATPSYMARCRSLNAEIGKFEQNLREGRLPDIAKELEMSSKKHPYVM